MAEKLSELRVKTAKYTNSVGYTQDKIQAARKGRRGGVRGPEIKLRLVRVGGLVDYRLFHLDSMRRPGAWHEPQLGSGDPQSGAQNLRRCSSPPFREPSRQIANNQGGSPARGLVGHPPYGMGE
jgi:hypothetical protein